jgi:type II secretory ATPase GspE/PulE/Tfp pilus assembly ATPase PilB-like protein
MRSSNRLVPLPFAIAPLPWKTLTLAMHHDLLSALEVPRGLIVVAGPTSQGKTTVIEKVLADPACPSNVVFVGDLRDREAAQRAVSAARSRVVVAVLRIPRAAAAFRRLIDFQVPATDVAEVAYMAFSTRLFRPSQGGDRAEFLLLHERMVVTDAIRALIVAGAATDSIHRRAMVEGMRSLRQIGFDQVRTRRLTPEIIAEWTPED